MGYLKKHKIIIAAIIIICFPISYSIHLNNKIIKYQYLMIPFTDEIMNLLVQRKYDVLYEKFKTTNSMDYEEFSKSLKQLNEIFGNIIKFKYKKYSVSYDGIFGDLTSYFLYYDIELNNKSDAICCFSFSIDTNTNMPKIREILNFYLFSKNEDEYYEIKIINQEENGKTS